MPRYGSQATRRPLPSIETAIAPPERQLQHRGVGLLRAGARCASRRGSRTARTPSGARRGWRSAAARAGSRRGRRAGRARAPAPGTSTRSAPPARGRRPGTRRPARGPACRRPARSSSNTRSRRVSVTSPIAVALTSHFSQTATTSSTRVGLDHAQHPLLGLRDHDLEGLHVGLAQRHLADVDVDPDLALRRHLGARRRQPRRAEVLQRDEQPALEQLQRALEQLLLLERVADLDGRALGGVELVELGRRQHRRAADPVAPRARAEQQHDVADARGRRADQVVLLDQPEAHRVDEAVRPRRSPRSRSRRRPSRRRSSCRSGRCRRPPARAGSASGRCAPTSPKRSESRIAIGRAPTAKTSRRMPPTPVAAPWNGSTALGWLCDSTLNAHASPPPSDTAPAFSPGPMTTRAALGRAACAAAAWSACRRSAPTTSARRPRARPRSARAPCARR